MAIRRLVAGGQVLLVALVALLVALVVGALAVERVLWLELTASTQGTVVGVTGSPGEPWAAYEHYIAFSDADGRAHFIVDSVFLVPAVGQRTEVWYDPDDPTSAATPTSYIGWTVGMGVVALLASLVAYRQATKVGGLLRGSPEPPGRPRRTLVGRRVAKVVIAVLVGALLVGLSVGVATESWLLFGLAIGAALFGFLVVVWLDTPPDAMRKAPGR